MIFNSEISTRRKLAYFFGVDVKEVVCNDTLGVISAPSAFAKNPFDIRNALKYLKVGDLYVKSSDLNLLPPEIIATRLYLDLDQDITDSKLIFLRGSHINISEIAATGGSFEIAVDASTMQITKSYRETQLDWLTVSGYKNTIYINTTYKIDVESLIEDLRKNEVFGLNISKNISDAIIHDCVSGVQYKITPVDTTDRYRSDAYVNGPLPICANYNIEVFRDNMVDGYGI